MEFLLLIYANESDDPKPGTPEGDAFMNGYFAWIPSSKHGSIEIRPILKFD